MEKTEIIIGGKLIEDESTVNRKEFPGVLIARQTPLHNAHQVIVDLMIKRHGCENVFVGIWSCNKPLWVHDIYTYEQRNDIFTILYENIKHTWIPDYPNDNDWHSHVNSTLRTAFWNNYKNAIFYGWSREDLHYCFSDDPDKRRNTCIVNRYEGGLTKKISASEIRDILWYHSKADDIKDKLKDYVDSRVIDKVISDYNINSEQLKKWYL